MKAMAFSYPIALIVFVAVDFLWLSRAADAFYRPVMGDMAMDGVRLAPAVAFYLIYATGMVVFAIGPTLAAGDWASAALRGAFFGFCAYATYDLTNQATLKNWSTMLTIVDIGWGSLLTAFSAAIACKGASWLAS